MGGPRSNYSRLPEAVRRRVLYLRHDGAEYAEIRADEAVAKACRERGFTLNNATFSSQAFKRDLADFAARARQDEDARRIDKLSAAVVETSGAAGDAADVARYELMRELRALMADLSELSDPSERIKAARQLAASMAQLTASQSDKRLADRDRTIAEQRDALSAAEAEVASLKTEVASLKADNRKLREDAGTVSRDEVIEELNKSVGVE